MCLTILTCMSSVFDPNCCQCSRLANYLSEIKRVYPGYHAAPVAPFGVVDAELLIVGLAPGLHGANATGRPFTGDHAGILLYETLYEFGFSNKPVSESRSDDLRLKNCRISNAVKCVPPQNKPLPSEIGECNRYLAAELSLLPEHAVILALGTIAHSAVLKAYGFKPDNAKFGHNVCHVLPNGRKLIDSYHCSRYNTQTKRLTKDMFADVFRFIDSILARNSDCDYEDAKK